MLLDVSNLARREAMNNALLPMAMSSHGSVVQLVQLLLGNNEGVAMIAVDTIHVTQLRPEMLPHGQEIVDVEMAVAITSEAKTVTTLPPLPKALHLGNKQLLPTLLLEHPVVMLVILLPAMGLAILKQIWALHQVLLPRQD